MFVGYCFEINYQQLRIDQSENQMRFNEKIS